MNVAAAWLCLVLAAPAPSSPPIPRGNKLEAGERLFRQGDFEAALKALEAAAQETAEAAALEKIHLLRAQAHAARQEFARSEEAFAQALEANPEAALDPAKVDPTVVKLLEAVRARLTGTLVMNSNPQGAALFLDSRNAGVTPQTLQVPVGKHKLEARWGDGPMSGFTVLVRPRREVRVEWVQGPPRLVPSPTTPEEDSPVKVRPTADTRFTLEVPADRAAAVRTGFDLGVGFELSWFRLGVWARLAPNFGVIPRAGLAFPLVDWVNVTLELSVPFHFLPPDTLGNSLGLGLGGQVGAEFWFVKWIGVGAAIGGQHLFFAPRNDLTHFTATVAVRLRLP